MPKKHERIMSNQEPLVPKSKPVLGASYVEAALFDTLASAYDNWFEEEGKLVFAIEVRAFQEVLVSLPKPWLEIGVGSGRFAQALGIETGIDPSTKLLELASKRGVTVVLGRGEQQIFRAASFGTIFLILTLCFINSASDVLKEAYRILAPSGKIVLGLVLKESSWGRFYEQKKKQGHRFYKHATFYGYNDIVKLLEQAGFLTERVISTLFQKPDKVEHAELPQEGFSGDAGFVIIIAKKNASEKELSE